LTHVKIVGHKSFYFFALIISVIKNGGESPGLVQNRGRRGVPLLRVHLDALGRETEGVREMQEEAAVGRRVKRRRREDPILAYLKILEKRLEELREEVSTRG
jgi:hypothetical protein